MSKQKARSILQMLKTRHVPESIELDYFTTGDRFRQNMLKLQSDILDLLQNPNTLERRILGGFGAGKTHALSYLEWLLQCNAPPTCVVSRIDLSRLQHPSDLQYLIVQEMRTTQGGNYAQVLRNAYLQIQEKYLAQYQGVGKRDIERLYGSALFSILGVATGGVVNREVLEALEATKPLDRFVQFLSGRDLQARFDRARTQADAVHIGFVEAYLELIRHPEVPITAFENPARHLATQSKLTDVVFKVLAWTGCKLIVVLVDELETLSRDPVTLAQTLVAFRDFRDTLGDSSRRKYPAVALICASTDSFFDDVLRNADPALYSRWKDEDEKIQLTPLSASDIDALIFKLRDLYYLAGDLLEPVEALDESSEHQVIQLRKRILDEYATQQTPLTSRELMVRLIKEIERTWLRRNNRQ